jgi:hypothetical protein
MTSKMIKCLVIHNKHEGCYDFQCYQDEVARLRLTSITINPPKIFMFNTREEAQDFFEDYINDIDCIDIKCKNGEDVEHIDYCTCGIIELDETGEPVLFYNKKNQIFLMENGPQVFLPNQEIKNDVKNMNLTNSLIRKCRTLGREQRKKYIELGKYCEDCNSVILSDDDTEVDKERERAREHARERERAKDQAIEFAKEQAKARALEKSTNNNITFNVKVETMSTPIPVTIPTLVFPPKVPVPVSLPKPVPVSLPVPMSVPLPTPEPIPEKKKKVAAPKKVKVVKEAK